MQTRDSISTVYERRVCLSDGQDGHDQSVNKWGTSIETLLKKATERIEENHEKP